MNKLRETGWEGIFILASRPPTTTHPVPLLMAEHPHVGPGCTSQSRIDKVGSAKKEVACRPSARFAAHSAARYHDPVRAQREGALHMWDTGVDRALTW